MNNDFFVHAALWLSGANLLVALSLKRQGLSYKYMLTPLAVAKLQGRDWGLMALLCIIVFAVAELFSR